MKQNAVPSPSHPHPLSFSLDQGPKTDKKKGGAGGGKDRKNLTEHRNLSSKPINVSGQL